MIRRMLVADDGSQGGEQARSPPRSTLASRLGVGLAMICVEELPRFPATHRRGRGGAWRTRAACSPRSSPRRKRRRAAAGVAVRSRMSSPGIRLRASPNSSSARGYDLLVVGFMGHSALYNRVIGSTPIVWSSSPAAR